MVHHVKCQRNDLRAGAFKNIYSGLVYTELLDTNCAPRTSFFAGNGQMVLRFDSVPL